MKVGVINISSGGFFSNFFVTLSTAIETYNNGFEPYVVLNNTVFAKYSNTKDNTWEWWFDQYMLKTEDVVENVPQNCDHFKMFPAPFGDLSWSRKEIIESRKFFDRHFKIKKHILLKSDSYYENNIKNKITLGIMARGTEFNKIHPQYGNHNVYSYIVGVRNILKEHPEINNIFIVTEDNDWIKTFEKELNNVIYMDVFRRTTQPLTYCINNWEWCYENKNRENHTKILGDECIYQTLLLGKCEYLLCKRNSMSAGAILFNDNIKNVYYI